MKTEMMLITPVTARQMLKANTKNRPMRPGVVERFRMAWDRHEWKVTHQGIAFGKSGVLLDGQHRLTFISQLQEGTAVAVNVSTDVTDDAFDAIDQGFGRTLSDVYQITADLAAAARVFARVANGNQSSGLTAQYVRPFIEWVQPEYERLTTFCPTKRHVWASATVRAAAICQMKRGHDADFVQLAYHSLVHADVAAMPSAVRALFVQRMSGKTSSARSPDLFCRALRAFDSRQTNHITKILIKDASATIAEVREWVMREMKKGPDDAGQAVAKPDLDSKVRALR